MLIVLLTVNSMIAFAAISLLVLSSSSGDYLDIAIGLLGAFLVFLIIGTYIYTRGRASMFHAISSRFSRRR